MLTPVATFLLHWGAQNWTQDSRCGLTRGEGKDHLLPAGNNPNASQGSCLCWKCWLMFNLVSIRTPMCFSAKLLPSWTAPTVYWCRGLILPTQNFALPFVGLREVPVSPFLQPVKVPLVAQPSGVSAAPPDATERFILQGGSPIGRVSYISYNIWQNRRNSRDLQQS